MSLEESNLDSFINEECNHAEYAMQLTSASILPLVLKAAIELGVLEILAKAGPNTQLSASQIVSELSVPSNNPNYAPFDLDPILCLLASHSILTCSLATNHQGSEPHRLYGLAPVAKYFVQDQNGGSLAPLLNVIQGKVVVDTWYHLKEAVTEGKFLFNTAHGLSAMQHQGLREQFMVAMKGYNRLLMDKLLEIYQGFEGIKTLVDVGGGDGSVLNRIISKYPMIKGINYDLPPIIEKAPAYPGIEHVAGDMSISIPKGDAIFMKWVIHFWNDEQCLKILKSCYEALPADGKLMIVEMAIPENPNGEDSFGNKSLFQFYLFTKTMNPARRERTLKEFQSLGKEAGFSHVHLAASAFNFTVVEFTKDI